MGAIVETPSIYLDMTAEENLKAQYRILGLPSFDGIPGLITLVGLSNTGKKKAKSFSLKMKQRLAIAVALCGRTNFLVLDEPTNGLDPQGIVEIREGVQISTFVHNLLIRVSVLFFSFKRLLFNGRLKSIFGNAALLIMLYLIW